MLPCTSQPRLTSSWALAFQTPALAAGAVSPPPSFPVPAPASASSCLCLALARSSWSPRQPLAACWGCGALELGGDPGTSGTSLGSLFLPLPAPSRPLRRPKAQDPSCPPSAPPSPGCYSLVCLGPSLLGQMSSSGALLLAGSCHLEEDVVTSVLRTLLGSSCPATSLSEPHEHHMRVRVL